MKLETRIGVLSALNELIKDCNIAATNLSTLAKCDFIGDNSTYAEKAEVCAALSVLLSALAETL